jgi:MHS family proline/betaine transporter-like MFS transporter
MNNVEKMPINTYKNVLASFLGSVSELYEFVVYAFCAPFLAPLFFPGDDELISILCIFGTFAVGFLMRPIGALIFGYFGDKHGRQKTVSISIILIGLPTVVMGIMPTYSTIGIFAPIMLILVRIIQGISLGGQFTGSAVFINEHMGNKNAHLASGITFVGAFIGMLIASCVWLALTSLLSENEIASWGWRIPFILGIAVTIIGYYIKSNTTETPQFKNLKQNNSLSSNPISEAFKTQKMNMLLCLSMCWLTPIIIYQLFIFMPIYAQRYLNIPLAVTLEINAVGMIILSIFTILFGYLADKIGYKIVMLTATVLLGALGYPLYMLAIYYHTAKSLLIVQISFAVLGAGYIGPVMGILNNLFSVKARYTALSFSYNLGIGIFGGTVAILNIIFIEKTGLLIFPAIYLSIAVVISIVTLLFIIYREKYKSADFYKKLSID